MTRGWLFAWLPAAAVLLLGWSATWFLCDDAYIAFRYVANAHEGHGLVWNRAPFLPVEGYSCFLWVLSLRALWWVTGLPPTVTANPLALCCALLTLMLLARRLSALAWPPALQRWRVLLVATTLVAIASNHTFVSWSSSGLETAMFGLFAVGWTLAALAGNVALPNWSPSRLLQLSLWAALAQLTRPDGALLCLGTLAIAVLLRWRGRLRWRDLVLGLAPLLLVVVHLLWRFATYGEWLPNTYYAKVTAAWPESGLRYLFCFLYEHGGVCWLLLAAVWLLLTLRRQGFANSLLRCWQSAPAVLAIGVWLGYVGYYSLVVGGDHFAYRPFAHLVALGLAAALAMGVSLRCSGGVLLALLGGLLLACNGFGWAHELALRGREKDGFVRLSTGLAAPIAALLRPWERHHAWLRLRYVALPRALHAVTCAELVASLPARQSGLVVGLEPGQRGIYRTVAAGVVGWTLADVDILDAVGLNDWVVARSGATVPAVPFDAAQLAALFPVLDRDGDARLGEAEIRAAAEQFGFGGFGVPVSPGAWADLLLAICDRDGDGLDAAEFAAAVQELQNRRHMAHERVPPEGYEAALRPNVRFDGVRFVADPEVVPLGDEEVREVERRFRVGVGG